MELNGSPELAARIDALANYGRPRRAAVVDDPGDRWCRAARHAGLPPLSPQHDRAVR